MNEDFQEDMKFDAASEAANDGEGLVLDLDGYGGPLHLLLELARKGSGAVILPVTAIPNEAGLVSLPIEDIEIERQIIALRYRHQPSRPETDKLLREIVSQGQRKEC